METLRTPDERFAALPDFPYPPHYAEVPDPSQSAGATLRMAWVEHGPADGEPVLLLHGEPTWSFLYRRMIPPLAAAGLRVIAPDMIGFGRSDKPARIDDHSYARHVEWLRALLFDVLDLRAVTVVGQDWGGLLGLRLVAEHPGPGRPLRRREHRPADRRHADAGSVVAVPRGHDRLGRASTSAASSQSGCRRRLDRRTSAPPTTRRSRTRATAPGREPCRCSSRPPRTTRPVRRTAPPGRPCASWIVPRWWRSATVTRSPARWRRCCCAELPRVVNAPITGAGHFLQEDRGAELAQAIAGFILANP